MLALIKNFRKLETHIVKFIIAELFIQLINNAFFLILLIYMQKMGYSDHHSAGFVSVRFLGVLAFAFPLGLYIRTHRIKPLLLIGSALVPVFALMIIYSIEHHFDLLLYFSQFLWGCAFCLMQVTSLPYILRNAKTETHTEAIALSYATYSFGGILSGLIIYVLSNLEPGIFSEKLILQLIAGSCFVGVWFIYSINHRETVPDTGVIQQNRSFDYPIIFRALFPTLIIATGAGLTIPFISIFFFNIHGMDSNEFSFVGAIAAVLVAVGALLVPDIKRKWGYELAVPLTQSIAVIALALLATTEWYKDLSYAVYIALACYLIRQPLMNMAGPMTSEVVMDYVGERNREIVSALTSCIWSGSWFVSSLMFKQLRGSGFGYGNVFLITAALYAVGVIWYYFLIREHGKRKKAPSLSVLQ